MKKLALLFPLLTLAALTLGAHVSYPHNAAHGDSFIAWAVVVAVATFFVW